VAPHEMSPHAAGDLFKMVAPSSFSNRGVNRADEEPNLSVTCMTSVNAKGLPNLLLQKDLCRRSRLQLSKGGHAEVGHAGGGNDNQLLKRLKRHLCAQKPVHKPACSKQRCTIHTCPRFEDFYQLISDVMPSAHRGMEIKRAVSRHSKEEVIVKVRWKASSFHSGEENAWRASTEMMLNLPPCRSIARVQQVLETPPSTFVSSPDVSPSSRTSPESGGRNSPAAARSIVKLIDFDTIEQWLPMFSKALVVLGSDQYIAPEAYEGNYSPASDIFAVGVLAYMLLSGSFPFPHAIFDDKPGENRVGSPKMQQIRDRLHKQRIDWGHPVFRANPAAQQLIDRMLAINKARRPSAREVLADPWLAVESV